MVKNANHCFFTKAQGDVSKLVVLSDQLQKTQRYSV